MNQSIFWLSDELWEQLRAEAPLHHRRRADLAFQMGYRQAITDLRKTMLDLPCKA